MLTIRNEQIKAFEERVLSTFSTQAIDHLRTELADLTAGLSDDALLERVRFCMPRASAYGLESAAEIMAFVDATYLLDDEYFDVDPDYWWAPEILHNRYLTPREKATQLLDSAFTENQLTGEE
ncbi:MAG TPA: hypothetical protein VIS96_18645 [Terrimicrobiaceae bacterium]